jgi:hypothetical protein
LGGTEAPPFAAGRETDDGLSAVLIGAADAPAAMIFSQRSAAASKAVSFSGPLGSGVAIISLG